MRLFEFALMELSYLRAGAAPRDGPSKGLVFQFVSIVLEKYLGLRLVLHNCNACDSVKILPNKIIMTVG